MVVDAVDRLRITNEYSMFADWCRWLWMFTSLMLVLILIIIALIIRRTFQEEEEEEEAEEESVHA